MYPARATLQHVIKAWWKVAWQKAGKTLPVFFFVNEHNNLNTNTKPQAKKQRFLKFSQERKQQLVEEKDADNIRKVLCKSFIQWFWELNLCCYKYRVDYFGSLRFFYYYYYYYFAVEAIEARRTNIPADWSTYKNLKHQVRKLIRQA